LIIVDSVVNILQTMQKYTRNNNESILCLQAAFLSTLILVLCVTVHCILLCHRAELLAQELKELQAELGDYNTVICTALILNMVFAEFFLHFQLFGEYCALM